MSLNTLNKNSATIEDEKVRKEWDRVEKLLLALGGRELGDETVTLINEELRVVNEADVSDRRSSRSIARSYQNMIGLLEKHENIVPPNHYQTRWMAIGMSTFGISLGVAFGIALGSMAFIGIGLPIGLSIGIGIGSGMDKKAAEEGRQLDI